MNAIMLKGKVYNGVKYTVLVAIPAVSTAYIGLDAALDGALPAEDQVVKSLAVLALLLGSLVGISANNYNNSEERFDGTAFVDRSDPTNNPDVMLKSQHLGNPPKVLTLKVQETQPPFGGPDEGDPGVEPEGIPEY